MLEGCICQRVSLPVAHAAPVQLVDDLLLGRALGVLLKHIADDGRGFLVRDKAVVFCPVTVWDAAAAVIPLFHALAQAALYVLRKVGRVVFRHALQQPFQDDSFRAVGDVLFYRHNLDAILFQTGLVDGAVVAVAGEPVQLPDDHHFKLTLGRVLDHALEVRAGVLGAGQGAVYIFAYDGDPLLLRPGVIIMQLALYGLLCLAMGRIAGIDYRFRRTALGFNGFHAFSLLDK
nr:hypothetical protein [uncultured Bilophila sp.]